MLGIKRLAVMGHSGGGPHALACAELLDNIVPAVAVLASPAPYGAPGLDYFAGMGESNIEESKLRVSDHEAADASAAAHREEFLQTTPEGMAESMRTLLSPVDLAAFTDELAEYLVETTRDGLGPGPEGWCDDDRATLGDWGFEVSEIGTPVLLMHGRQDQFVPFGHGQWLASQIPGVEARLPENEGHLSLIDTHLGEVFDWLLDRR
jgi:pimeloyl-ACP methyl ester carboxylesterase